MYKACVLFLASEVFAHVAGMAMLFCHASEMSLVYSSCFVKCFFLQKGGNVTELKVCKYFYAP